MEENEEFNYDFNPEDIPISEEFWNYMEHYWHNNREFPESTEASLNRKADLVDGKVPSSQLPSYVDDVLEYDTFESLPNSGEKGKIYVITNNNTQFRWSGTEYIQLNSDWINQQSFFNKKSIKSETIASVSTSLNDYLPNGGFITSYNNGNWGGADIPDGASYGGYIKFSDGNNDYNNLDLYYNNGHNALDSHRLWFRTKNNLGNTNWFELFHKGNFNPNTYIPASHPVSSITQANINNWLLYKGYEDNRSVAPNHLSTQSLQYGFGSWDNNNNYPWADYLHFGGYSDSTGGLQNLIMFNKSGFGFRQYLGNPQDANQYADFVDYWHTGNFNPSDYVTINTPQTIIADKTFGINSLVKFLGGENNHVTLIKDGTILNTIVSGFKYSFYDAIWKVGNRRGGSANSLGYSFEFSTDAGNNYDEKVLIQPDGNIKTSSFGSASDWNAKVSQGQLGNYLPLSGGTLTGGGRIDAQGNITVQQNDSGGNATGIWWDNIVNIDRIAGIGALTTNGVLNHLYMGWGPSPWDVNTSLSVSPEIIQYKGNLMWHAGNLEDYHQYGLGRTDAVATPDLNNVTSTSIQDIVDTSLNRPFGYGSVWTHRKGGAEFTQMAVNVLDGRLYTRGWSNGMGDTGWNRLALYSEVSGNYALRDGSNATDTWANSSFGLISNPTIPGKMYNSSGASDLINATYGSVTGIVNTAGVTNGNPNDEWFHRIKMLHSNAGGYYTEIGIQMTGGNSMWYKRYQNGTNYDWVKVWDAENFNPDTKVNALENARAIGFSSGNYPTQNGVEYPYMYFDNGSTTGYVALATQDFVNSNFATSSELANYATLDTYQTITGDKIFTGFVKVPPAYDGDEAVPYNQLLEALDLYTVRNHDGLAKYLGFTGANITNAPYIKTSTDEVITLATEKWSYNNFVSLSRDQNIDGRKRFTNPVRLPEAINNDEAVNYGQATGLALDATNTRFLTRSVSNSATYDLSGYGSPKITNIVCKGNGGFSLDIDSFEKGMTVKVSNTTGQTIDVNFNNGSVSTAVDIKNWAEFHVDSEGDIIRTDANYATII